MGQGQHLKRNRLSRVRTENAKIEYFLEIFDDKSKFKDRPWWPSGLIRHVSNLSRDLWLGSKFKSPLGIQYR